MVITGCASQTSRLLADNLYSWAMLHLPSPSPEADIFNSLLTWLLHHLAPESGPASGVTSGHLDTFPFGWMMESLIAYASSWNVFQLTCWLYRLFSLMSVSYSTLSVLSQLMSPEQEADCAAPEHSQILTWCDALLPALLGSKRRKNHTTFKGHRLLGI